MKRNVLSWSLVLVALGCCAGLASAEERSGRAKSAKDPVEAAFALPQGTHLTSGQAKALNKMRHDYEPQLREALDTMTSATDEKAKRNDAKNALRIRQTIRGQIDQILSSNGGYEASATAPATYESRYPTSSGTGEAPYNYYGPYVYPVYPYPVYPGVVYPYYSRPYYWPPKTTATTTSQNKPTSTTRPAYPTKPTSTTRPAYQTSTGKTPNTSSGGSKTTTAVKR